MADVGLLFTDVEASTAHLRALGPSYAAALARHHTIIRRAVDAEGGIELGSEGDSIAALFPSAGRAVRAAVVAQRGIAAEPWPDGAWLVRMAVHAGDVEQTDAGPVGMALHEAARLRSIAHGGQIVVSEQARAAIREPMPADVQLLDLGSHPIRDFTTSVRVHQVVAPGLSASFPPPRTHAARGVPPDRTPFIGRRREIAEVADLVKRFPLVTLVGPGGSGKTRLAYEVARRCEREVAVVELAGLRDGGQVPAAVAAATGADDPEALRHRDLLVVLDNCEHVVGAVAGLVATIIGGSTSVLATSREPVRVRGEMVWPVPILDDDEAVELFADRAGVTVSAPVARGVCARLGWMPLAIELAAARAHNMPLDALVARLDDQLGLLTRGPRDVPRQETLRATLDWSHDLLSDAERTIFRRLAVFAGGFTAAAADFVAGDGDDDHVLDTLDDLVAKSLVELDRTESRYRMLEPVRQYASEHLRSAGEERFRRRHAEWARKVSREASLLLFVDPLRWTSVLDAEGENVAAAIDWSLEHDLATAVDITVQMAWYWFTARQRDGIAIVPRLLERLDEMEARDRGNTLRSAAMVCCDAVEDPRPLEWLLEAETIARDEGRDRQLGAVLFWLGRAAAIRGRMDITERALSESVDVHDRLGELFGWGWSKVWIASLLRLRGELDASDAVLDDVMARCETVPHVIGAVLMELSRNAGTRADVATAASYARDAVDLYRRLGDQWQVGIAEVELAEVLIDDDEAAAALVRALRAMQAVQSDVQIERAFIPAAWLLLQRGRDEQAAILAGAAQTAMSDSLLRWWRPSMSDVVPAVRALTVDPRWAAATERGRRRRPLEWVDVVISWLEEA